MNPHRMTRPGNAPHPAHATSGALAHACTSTSGWQWQSCKPLAVALLIWSALAAQPVWAQGDLQLKASPELKQAPERERVPGPFAPATPGLSALNGIPMGTGDQININVFGQPDLTTQVTLDAVGMITLPLIGPIKALGLLPRQLEQLVAKRLVEGGYLKEADVVINVQQTRSRFFSVLGEVARPGRYPLENKLSLLDALAEAGGATDKAEPVVTLIRGTDFGGSSEEAQPSPAATQRFTIDPRTGPDPALANSPLRNRDVLFVPAKQVFYVYGEVRSPGVFVIEPGLSLLKALSIAGGLTDRGSDSRVMVTRKNENGQSQEAPAELTEPIRPGDVIRVKERLF